MREIEFRGRMVTGEWVYGDLTHDLPDSTVYYKDGITCRIHWQEESARCNAPVIDKTVGQYTGLKDKNGKEIYEGDVIKWQPKEPFEAEFIMPVVFHNGCFATVSCCGHTQLCWCGYIKDGLEIIGNIYENPELLKGGK